ncbi:MAG: electron transfer flavoprotein subunit alpha [SAR324 cluster bacterium]|uniref:Electron transfer flavoprotein subunit alpha n=1 Tax=SAR324 cluster bacterium TaxID=2024889 RepID=A0A7X9FS99_9DELT|nr:electron transfer flavoprotein subunit alpha [SAR324 cluster bacterium]
MAETILYLAHTDVNGKLPKVALEVLSKAQEISSKLNGSSLVVGLIGKAVQEAANSLGNCGASKFLAVSGPDFEVSRYSSDIIGIEALVRKSGASIVLAPSTSRVSRTLAGVASRMNASIDTRISAIDVNDNELVVQRWYYKQRMLATFSRKTRPWMLVVDSGISAAYDGKSTTTTIENIPVEIPVSAKRTEVIGTQAPQVTAQTIRPEAELLFVAGAGWTKKQQDGNYHVKEAERLILGFLDKAKASLGSSKSLVDQKSEGQEVISCMSHLNQIGQTGSSPRHQKGLATCCHGEEPHVVGWRFVNERRAINLDPNCGWAQGKADVLYVADAFAVMNKVNELLGG